MAQVFHPSTNAFSRATIFGGVFILAVLAWAGGLWSRSSYVTLIDVVRDQPVPFSHEHHVSGLGIDCRYCHTSVETSSFAGIPATEVCMGCHSQIWKDSPLLAPVRDSYRTGEPLKWTRDVQRAGARLAFGRPVDTLYHFDRAEIVLSLDADFLLAMRGSVRYARDFISRRPVAAGDGPMSRLYVAESTPTITGASADHRLPLTPRAISASSLETGA